MERLNKESLEIKGDTEGMRVSGFMHVIKNRQLIERLNNKVLQTVEKMTEKVKDFIGSKEVATLGDEIGMQRSNREKRHNSWRSTSRSQFPHSRNERLTLKSTPRLSYPHPYVHQEVRQNVFTLLSKTPCEILLIKPISAKFVGPPPMSVNPKRKHAYRYCEFYQDKGHNSNDCYKLKKHIEEVVCSSQLAHINIEIKFGAKRNGQGTS